MQPIARYRPQPLQHRGHAARRGQAADRSAEASTRSPRLAVFCQVEMSKMATRN